MASTPLSETRSKGRPERSSDVSIYGAASEIWKNKGWSLFLLTLYLIMALVRLFSEWHHVGDQELLQALLAVMAWLIVTLAAWGWFIYLQRRTKLKFDAVGMTLTDRSKPKLIIDWDNVVLVDIYDGYVPISGTRVAVKVTSVEECFVGLTDREKRPASKAFIYGPHLICFSTEMLKIKGAELASEIRTRSAAPVAQNGSVESILVTEEFDSEPLAAANPVPSGRRVWSLSIWEKLLCATIGIAALAGVGWTFAADGFSQPAFDLVIGLILLAVISVLVWFVIDSPWMAIDSRSFAFQDMEKRKASIPLHQVAGTQIRVGLSGLQRSIDLSLRDSRGKLDLPTQVPKFGDGQGNEVAVVSLSLYQLRALPQEFQPELHRRIARLQQDPDPGST